MTRYRIAFIHDGAQGFTPRTAETKPLGGTQAAAGYLGAALAACGHKIWLFSHLDDAVMVDDVECVPIKKISADILAVLDVVVLVQSLDPGLLLSLRTLVRPECRIFLWTGQAYDQPALAALADTTLHDALNGIWAVSDWQGRGIADYYGIARDRIDFVRNAVAPAFEALARQPRCASTTPQRAFYSSTPFRGLSLLLDVFAAYTTPVFDLHIFGGMVQYHQDDGPWQSLYDRARGGARCFVHGALAHRALAEKMADQDLWLYPSIFAETSCINALEALAVGALPVVSTLGALPETLGDMAVYVPYQEDHSKLSADFLACLHHVLMNWRDIDHNSRIVSQKAWILQHAIWSVRAAEVGILLASK